MTNLNSRLYRQKWGEPEPDSPAGLDPKRYVRRPCKHLGEPTGEMVSCGQCGNSSKTKLKVFHCGLWKECTPETIGRRVDEHNTARYLPNCKTCKQYDPGDVTVTTNEFVSGEKDPISDTPQNVSDVWAYTPQIKQKHDKALKELLSREFKPAEKAEGRGVILCGGSRYWPMLMLSLRMLRDVSDLPVQIWHRGDDEPVPVQDLKGILNVTVHNAYETIPRPRILNCFEIKTHALVHCGWEQVLYLDADAYLLQDPRPLFDLVDRTGFVYWPNMSSLDATIDWKQIGLTTTGLPPVQGGQYLIDRKKAWRELLISYWLDQHADYYYRHLRGDDQDSWRVAFAGTRAACHCIQEMEWREVAWICKLDKREFVAHRCGGKLWLHSEPRHCARMPKEDRVFEHLLTLGFDRYTSVTEAVKNKLKLLA